MSIIEKVSYEETDLNEFMLEIKSLVMLIDGIVGDELAPSDELAELLVTLRRGMTGPPEDLKRAVRTINDAIELCFLHSETYKVAFELFQIEKSGELVSDTTAKGLIIEAIEQAGSTVVSPTEVEPIKTDSVTQSEDESDNKQPRNSGQL